MKKRSIFLLLVCVLAAVSACTQHLPQNSVHQKKGTFIMESAWSLTDTNDFVIAISEHLDQKTQYGNDLSVLSEAERIFYITQALEMEVNNGGFSQFFYNASGDFTHEVVSAFTAIGAHATAAICQKAIDAWGCPIPVNRDERIAMMEALESDKTNEILEECDNGFYAYEDNLNELNYQFAIKNKADFN